MRRSLRACLALSAALTLGCGALVTSATSAFAATCSGTGCDGTDPYGTGCAGTGASYWVVETAPLIKDSTGVASDTYGYVQLWWSQTCGTNWTRMVVNASGASTGFEDVLLDRNNGVGVSGYTAQDNGSVGAHLTHQVYAGSILAESYGDLLNSSGIELYHASVAQPGF
jgi:Protein of unknown function (DUF2690)